MKHLLKDLRICVDKPGPVDLAKFPTDHGDALQNKELKEGLEEDREKLYDLQRLFYATDRHALLLVFQAMDAAGKDSCIRHVMSGVNPQGCQVWSFKAPSPEELDHDFLWRHAKAIPERGRIGIHNRSHYEEVLVVKVHPAYVLGQRIPGVRSTADIDEAFWESRYASIRDFEAHLARQGVIIMKFFLHMGRDAQRERFLDRIEDPSKNWKFSLGDVEERGHWDAYQQAYADAIGATAASHAPWYIVPADDQWETRAIVGRLVRERLEELDLRTPELSAKQRDELAEGQRRLAAEGR